ncbi:inorganic diphosphatase [Inmirania thermothiophila]|uniref:Inorganic pyrophosphatase n=1 Tax=Inmirania thermothiophila TaxID=1750597 RepID=A0A3N1Y7F8_9GAMM|nr:inorganic diphosphatase [Inmirania thermothiophila]ROR34766.1 inorganic pyrophosphatase [Inmirania thermothiophila]
MNLDRVGPGEHAPEEINVIIEIPAHADPVKYEIDKETGALFVDRFLGTAMHYPANYGYVPHTLAEDGDPVDVMVITPIPVITGAVIRCRPVGMLRMVDEKGPDAKLLAVPARDLSAHYHHVDDLGDLPRSALAPIEHFFARYKDLEDGKWTRIEGWAGAAAAREEVAAAIRRFREAPVKPAF